MKKVLFTGVALMAMTATTFAQSNETYINQTGNRSDASATQTGSWNYTYFLQDGTGTTAAQTNKAVITQKGAGSSFSHNIGVVDQQGYGHEVRLQQIARDGQTGNNYASFVQRLGNSGAFAIQNGQSNIILSSQRSIAGTAVIATLEQTGDRNYINIDGQTDVIDNVDFTRAYVRQFGNDNYARITQIGDANNTSVEQTSNWNSATTRQSGVSNKIAVVQAGSGATYNVVDVNQQGNRNNVLTNQSGNFNVIRLVEVGNDNAGYLYQSGSFQRVRGLYGDAATQFGNSLTLETHQDGSFQTVYSSQTGNFNSAYVAQSNN